MTDGHGAEPVTTPRYRKNPPNSASKTHAVCDVLKACRSEARSAPDVAKMLGYAKCTSVRISLQALEDQGIVESEVRPTNRVRNPTKFYRVAAAWRNDD